MNSKNQMTIGRKVTLACSTLVGLTLLVGGVSLNRFFDLKGKLHQMVDQVLPGVYGMSAVRTTTKDMREYMLLHATAENPAETARLEAAIQKFDAKIRDEMKNYEARMDAPADRAVWVQIVASYESFVTIWENRLRPLGRAGNQAQALAVYRAEILPARETLAAALDRGVAYNRIASQESAQQAEKSADRGHLPIVSIMAASSLAGVLLTLLIVLGVNRALRHAIADLERVAGTIRHTAAQVSESGSSIASGASQQAESLSTTFGACDMIGAEMKSSTAGLMDSAELVAELSKRLGDKATEGFSADCVRLTARIQSRLSLVRDSSSDQGRAMNAVTTSLSEIEQVTAAAEKEAGMSAAASQRMNSEAQSLTGVVDRLRALVDRSSVPGHFPPAGQGPGGLSALGRAVSNGTSVVAEPVAVGDRS